MADYEKHVELRRGKSPISGEAAGEEKPQQKEKEKMKK